MTRGMIHGRFQPFHLGHTEYLRGAVERSDEVFVGITNPDPTRIRPEASDPLRHLPESNPWSYAERLLMVKAAASDLRLDLARLHVIPFPVNEPELWPAYVPDGATQYIRLFSDWGGTKVERMREAGYEVVVLDEGAEKEISGADVREALRSDGDWDVARPARGRAGHPLARPRPGLVRPQAMHAGFWPAITRRQSRPSSSPRLTSLGSSECALWLGARDPEAAQHHLETH